MIDSERMDVPHQVWSCVRFKMYKLHTVQTRPKISVPLNQKHPVSPYL